MARLNRLEVPYEEPDEESVLESFGNFLKRNFVRDESKYPTTGRSIDFSGVSHRDRARIAAERKKSGNQNPVMGSSKNVDVGLGRGTVPMKPSEPAPKDMTKRNKTSRNAPKSSDGMDITYGPLPFPRNAVDRNTVEYDSGTLNPSEFGPATMGPRVGVERGNVTSQGTTRNYEAEFPVETFNPPARPMREGLFGEPISQEDYDRMTQKNKDAGFYGRFKKGGSVKKKPAKKMASGGSVSSASKRGDGCAQRGKTKGRMV